MVKQTATKATTAPARKKTPQKATANYHNKKRVHLYHDINARFVEMRHHHQMSQSQFAAWLGVKVENLKSMEIGNITPNIGMIRALKRRTKKSYDWIIDGPSENEA